MDMHLTCHRTSRHPQDLSAYLGQILVATHALCHSQVHLFLYLLCSLCTPTYHCPCQGPWFHIAIDFCYRSPSVSGKCGHYGGHQHLPVLKVSLPDSPVPPHSLHPHSPLGLWTTEVIFTPVFRYFGIPEDLISDWGVQCTSRMWESFQPHIRISPSQRAGWVG